MIKNIKTKEFQELQAQDNVVVYDVRTADEVAAGHIEGAKHSDILNGDFITEAENIDPSKTYLVYCRSGARSFNACTLLQQKGVENLYNLEGGILGWEGPIVKN